MNAVVPPDSLHEANIPRHLQRLRRFLTQQRIDATRQTLSARTVDGNPYREWILGEKQPWVAAFDAFDRTTLRGVRRLKRQHITDNVLLAACTGRLLDRIEPALTPPIAEAMRSRLLDLDGRAHTVLMEWGAAHFYLRHGLRIDWTQPNVPGPEFTGTGDGLTFEVECKRITRNAMELLGDRHAVTLGYAVLQAMREGQLAGDIVLDTPLTESPPRQDVQAAVAAVLQPPAVLMPMDVQIPGIGRLSGRLRSLGPGSGWAQQGDIDRRMAARPHDHRGFAIAVPHPHAPHPEAVVLWLRGPRRTPAEFQDHILATAMEGARQLTGHAMGVLMVEIESITEATVFRDTAAIEGLNQRVFAAQPALAAIVWQGERVWEPTADGFLVRRNVLAARNAACAFDATTLPLRDSALI